MQFILKGYQVAVTSTPPDVNGCKICAPNAPQIPTIHFDAQIILIFIGLRITFKDRFDMSIE